MATAVLSLFGKLFLYKNGPFGGSFRAKSQGITMLFALPGAQKALSSGAHFGAILVPLLIPSEFRPGGEIPSWTESIPSGTELRRPRTEFLRPDGMLK